MEPLLYQIDQIESNQFKKNELYRNYLINNVVPTIGQLAASAGKDIMWKPLHHQLLLKTRSENPKVYFLLFFFYLYFINFTLFTSLLLGEMDCFKMCSIMLSTSR